MLCRVAKLRFHKLGPSGTPYPSRVRRLRHRHGIYVFRDARTREILYVGESHSARLYQTMTRHLQAWNDARGHWGNPHKWHVAFRREDVEVAYRAYKRGASAVAAQNNLIRRYLPPMNRAVPEEPAAAPDECPF